MSWLHVVHALDIIPIEHMQIYEVQNYDPSHTAANTHAHMHADPFAAIPQISGRYHRSRV